MDTLITLAVIVGVLLLGFVVVPWLRKKGWLNKSDVETASEIILVAEMVLDKIKFKNEDIKKNILLVFDITDLSAKYVAKEIDVTNIEDKKQAAKDVAYKVLDKLNVKLDDQMKNIVDKGIDLAIDKMK